MFTPITINRHQLRFWLWNASSSSSLSFLAIVLVIVLVVSDLFSCPNNVDAATIVVKSEAKDLKANNDRRGINSTNVLLNGNYFWWNKKNKKKYRFGNVGNENENELIVPEHKAGPIQNKQIVDNIFEQPSPKYIIHNKRSLGQQQQQQHQKYNRKKKKISWLDQYDANKLDNFNDDQDQGDEFDDDDDDDQEYEDEDDEDDDDDQFDEGDEGEPETDLAQQFHNKKEHIEPRIIITNNDRNNNDDNHNLVPIFISSTTTMPTIMINHDYTTAHDGHIGGGDLHPKNHHDHHDHHDHHHHRHQNSPLCSANQFSCLNVEQCIDIAERCNDQQDCWDNSDEMDCECRANQFRCGVIFQCIDNRQRCDYKHDCQDETDELDCDKNVCALGQFRCQNGQCISERLKCNGIKDCVDGSDETQCVKRQCRTDQFLCDDGKKCIAKSLLCNQEYDCFDGSDELKCHENNCPQETMFRCKDGQCIPKDLRCNFHKDCFDGTDEIDCQMICGAHQFECHTDGHCIHESLRCDGFYDCFDFSDEQNCENRTCRLSQFRCGTGLCIDRALLCNGETDCPDRSDELECWICQKGEYTCANGRCIDMKHRCDGVQHCLDDSDEQDCPSKEIALQVYPERQTVRQGQEAVFRCRDEGDSRLPVEWLREGNKPLPPETVDNRGRLMLFDVQANYSGVYICTTATEIGPSLAQKAAYLTVQPTSDYEIMINHLPQNDQGETGSDYDPSTTTLANSNVCTDNEFTCSNGECILKEHVCDKDLDCSDQSDELNCQCQPNEYKCDNGFCILKVYRCDTENDCGDSSDERSCDLEQSLNSTCKMEEYQCESGNQCIPKSFQCDGRFDCQDKSDEIGCSKPTIVQNPSKTIITVEGETVTLSCRAIGLPVPLINWRKNGMHIPEPPKAITTSVNGLGTLTINNVDASDQGTYSCEAINSKESQMATHQTLLIVKQLNLLCQPPMFNDLATDTSECLECFCFGTTKTCYSSSIQPQSIMMVDDDLQTKLTIVSIGKLSNGSFVDLTDTYPPNYNAIHWDPISHEHSIDSMITSSNTPDTVYYYWSLPEKFKGNKLLSYGAHLKYSVYYRQPFTPNPLDIPDVIIGGNNRTMFHYSQSSNHDHDDDDDDDDPTMTNHQDNEDIRRMSIRFWAGQWQSNNPSGLIVEEMSRENILIILQNIDYIYIKASYDVMIMESSIVDIELESGFISNQSDPQRSAFIEHCICPLGYVGTSCEECAPGFQRQQPPTSTIEDFLGQCVQVEISCQCNGHSNQCDQYTGQCLNCQNHTQGFNCEQCERGYYPDPDGYNPIPNNDDDNANDMAINCLKCPCGSNIDHQNSGLLLPEEQDEWSELPHKWLLIPCSYDMIKRSVVCQACPIGYEGELCDRCAPGFMKQIDDIGRSVCSPKVDCPEGYFQCTNGTCINKSLQCNSMMDCLPDGNDEFGCESLMDCDPVGSILNISSIHQCQCKQLVTGSLCDKCKDGSFYLNEISPTGCIECFCFHVTETCNAATNLYRNHISVNIDPYSHGVMLRDMPPSTDQPPIIRKDIEFDHINRELIFKNFNQSTILYWQMPFHFLGNKITSYGGSLNFTFRFHGNYFHHRNADAILIGNNVTLYHFHQENLQPLFANTITIPLFETEWYLEDRIQQSSRRDLMIVLANLDAVLLLATVTHDISYVGLISATMDTSVEHFGKFDTISAAKVETVEVCHCPPGYSGTSCERCAPGYKQSSLSIDGFTCEPCFCNGHSIDCDPITGVCIDCQHYTTGPYCEKCLPYFEGNATQGTDYDCVPGSNESSSSPLAMPTPYMDTCACNVSGTKNSQCHLNTDSQCDCKFNVEGYRCDTCKEGYFHLSYTNPMGCLACFCFGVSSRCRSSSLHRTKIEANFSQYNENKFQLATRFKTVSYTDRVSYNFATNEAYFYSLFWLHEHPSDSDSNPETLYWFLPSNFLGNRLTSYGGKISFTRRYIIQTEGKLINDADVFLMGNGIMLQYISSAQFPPNTEQLFEIGVNAEDEMWQKIDHQTQMTGLASRADFLHVLAQVDMIAIRATFHTQMKESYLKNVLLDSATTENNGRPLALEVEECSCPDGYLGLSCERCAPNYLREIDQNGYFKCVPCRCNSHSKMCDPLTGRCVNCLDNTMGDHCEQCAPGYYGDATFGLKDDCQPCPCPGTGPGNTFSPTCKLDIDGKPTCTQCLKNYTGRNCELCNVGYTRNETIANGRCESIQSAQTIKVHIEGPKVKHVTAGSTLTLICNGTSKVSQYFNLDWIKLEGQLPPAYSEASGVLTIPNIQPEHGGTYVCSGFDLESVATAKTIVVVKPSMQKFAPKVHIEPEYLEVHVGNPVTFRCVADGFPKPRLSWKPTQDKILNPASSFQPETGVFFIPSAKKSDESEYECYATNVAGSDSKKTVLFVHDYHKYAYVHVNGMVPTARVHPSTYTAVKGEKVRFECNVTGKPLPSVRWMFLGAEPDGMLPNNSRVMANILTITNIDKHNNGVYTCIASNSHGTAEAQVRLIVNGKKRAKPVVSVEPTRQTVVQGQSAELRCVASGNPPPKITWQKLYDIIDPYRHKIQADRLIIKRMEIEDRGIYVCRAENIDGVSNSSAFVEIERREIPSVEIDRLGADHGSSIYFQCRITGGVPEPTIEWSRLDGSPFTSNAEINGGLLRFNQITVQDEGVYVCTAENLAGRATAQTTLALADVPRVKILQNTPYRVRQNGFVKLECKLVSLDTYTSNTPVKINWHKIKYNPENNQTFYELPKYSVQNVNDRAILEINSANLEDSGIYVCSLHTTMGESEDRIQLIVEPNSEIVPHVSVEEKVVTVAAGSRAELRCFVRGTKRNIIIKWIRADNISLPDMSRVENGTLTIDQVKPEDSGDYYCLGYLDNHSQVLFKNRARLAVVVPPRIQIDPPLQTVRPGDTAYIDCAAFDDSSHSVAIAWSRIGSELPTGVIIEASVASTNSRLIFKGIILTDAGKYLCTAANAAGRVEALAEIVVDEDIIQNYLEEFTIIGSNIQLKCPTELIEDLYIDWDFEETGSLPENVDVHGNQLKIRNVDLHNFGRYICTVIWNGTIIEENVVVLKHQEPIYKNCQPDQFQCFNGQCVNILARCNRINDCEDQSDEESCTAISTDLRITSNQDVIHLDDRLQLTCLITGKESLPHVKWSLISPQGFLRANVIVENNQLSIAPVEYENGGVYRCSLDTDGDQFEADYLLVIQELPAKKPEMVEIAEKKIISIGEELILKCEHNLSGSLTFTWKKYHSHDPTINDFISPNSIVHPNGTLQISSVNRNDSGTYICVVSDQENTVQIPVIIIIQGLVPRFPQKPLSYLSLPTLSNAYLLFELTVSIKPENPDGLILYNGKQDGADFISLGLKNSFVEFRFDLGSGNVVLLRSVDPVDLDQWSLIRVVRNKRIGKLKVNDQDIVISSSKEQFVGLDLSSPLYIGGVPSFRNISSNNGFNQGFIGCISLFKSNSQLYDLIKNSTYQHGVVRCDTCNADTCLNDGICRENPFDPEGFECRCSIGFHGKRCHSIIDACHPDLCNGGYCIDEKQSKFICHCPFGRKGRFCEQTISILEPLFSSGAYLGYRTPSNILNRMDIIIKIKPNFASAQTGYLLLYCGQYANGTGDFAALVIVNRTVEFRFDTGSGAAIIKSSTLLLDNEWVEIQVNREKREALLTIGNEETVPGRSPGKTVGLNLATPLYVGGYNKTKIILPSSLRHFSHFDGCVSKLEINHKEINLIERHIESANVDNCGLISMCQRSPCLNGGNCLEINQTFYECVCDDDHIGKNCERLKGICERTMPCLNKGECENPDDDNEDFVCHCSIGYFGPKCEKQIPFVDPHSARLNGRSYFSFDSKYLQESDLDFIQIKFKFKTTTPNGLMVYYGKLDNQHDNIKADFLTVLVNDSHLEMIYELGSGLGIIKTDDLTVDDGEVHDVELRLQGRDGYISLDDNQYFARSPGSLTTLNANGDVYFGCSPTFKTIISSKINTNGFKGCLSGIELGMSGELNLVKSSKKSRNLMPCDDF